AIDDQALASIPTHAYDPSSGSPNPRYAVLVDLALGWVSTDFPLGLQVSQSLFGLISSTYKLRVYEYIPRVVL
ncbi:hypothetical protein HDU79_002120, partial [Rhizoclosmatium sp. JEL0117]